MKKMTEELSIERIESIKLAIENETKEMSFYVNEAKRTNNDLAQSVFKQLARDEEEHLKKIKSLHQKLVDDGQWPVNVPIDVHGTKIRSTIDNLVQHSSSAEDNDDDDIAALKKAIVFEEQGSRFYADLARRCKNKQEQNFFGFLSRIEREHYLALMDTLSYLDDPDGWLMLHERHYLDG